MTRPAWSVRPKGERDAEAVAQLLADVSREARWIATEWPFDVEARTESIRTAILRRRVIGWVAVDGRSIVGDLTVNDIASPEPEIGMIVAAQHRGRGVGRALMDRALTWAQANRKPALRLRVFPNNEAALALYRACGFVALELQRGVVLRRDGNHLDAVLMRRPTPPR